MSFDFNIFTRMVWKIYNNPQIPAVPVYSIETSLDIFDHFFFRYRESTGHDHPFLSMDNARRYIRQMPYIHEPVKDYTENFWGLKIIPEANTDMIDQYFETEFREDNDRNIGHFFSAGVRFRLYYDTYGGYDCCVNYEDDLPAHV